MVKHRHAKEREDDSGTSQTASCTDGASPCFGANFRAGPRSWWPQERVISGPHFRLQPGEQWQALRSQAEPVSTQPARQYRKWGQDKGPHQERGYVQAPAWEQPACQAHPRSPLRAVNGPPPKHRTQDRATLLDEWMAEQHSSPALSESKPTEDAEDDIEQSLPLDPTSPLSTPQQLASTPSVPETASTMTVQVPEDN